MVKISTSKKKLILSIWLPRWFGSTKCKLHKQLYQNAQTKLRRHCLEKKKIQTHAPTTPALHHHCTVSAVQKIKKERITLCMVWCARVQIPFEFRWYQDLLFEWKLMPCNSSCHNGLKTFLNSYFKLLFCLTSLNFS